MDDVNPYLGLIVFILLLIVDIVIYGFTVALGEISEGTYEKDAENGDKKAIKILKYAEGIDRVRKTKQVVLAFSYMILGTMQVRMIIAIIYNNVHTEFIILRLLAGVVASIIVTMLYIAISMFAIHRLACKQPQKWVKNTLGAAGTIMTITKPIVRSINYIAKILVRLCGIDPDEDLDNVTEEDIMSMVNEGHEQGVLLASEAEMITNIFEFGDKEAKDIMTHRKNIVAIDGSIRLTEVVHVMLAENYSRFPVYDEEFDNIIGIIHFRDVMKAYEDTGNHAKTLKELKDIMMEPHFIPETRNINVLFKSMQSEKIHMEMVVDEYGQLAGVVTQEDILEEIVGNILDEHDEEEELIKKIGNDEYIMAGLTELEDIEDEINIEFEDEEYDTLNGFLISKLDRIPQENDRAVVEYSGFRFKVLEVKNKIIQKVKVTKIEEPVSEEPLSE